MQGGVSSKPSNTRHRDVGLRGSALQATTALALTEYHSFTVQTKHHTGNQTVCNARSSPPSPGLAMPIVSSIPPEPVSEGSLPEPPEITYHPVDLHHYRNALFSSTDTYLSGFDVSALLQSPRYQHLKREFVSSLGENGEQEGAVRDLFNHIVEQCVRGDLDDVHSERCFSLGTVQLRAQPSPDDEYPIVLVPVSKLSTWRWADVLAVVVVEARRTALGHTDAGQGSRAPGRSEQVDPRESPSHLQSSVRDALPHSAKRFVRYAKKVMCSLGNRQSVHGILFNGSFASFWCFDRGGGVFTHECNIDRDFPDLIRCLMSLCLANNTELGLEPMFQQSGVKDVELFGSVLQRYLVVQRSLFTISKTLHITSELDGRGTTVFKVITAPDGRTTDEVTEAGEETVIPEAAVIKFSWQSTSQALEIALFRRAQEFNVEGIATLYRYSSPRKLSDGHRKQLGLKVGIDYVDRELHVQVTGPVCIPLYRVVDEDDFAAAFKSLISAHHSLYKKAGILHRDISINNLMVDETNPQRGVLIDLDLAIQVRDGERVLGIRPSTVGTYPFLALDLFRDEPLTQRWYRHDLESFLYVLAWILSRFDEDGNEVHQTAAFDDWIFGEKKYIFLAKRGFLREAERFRPVRFSRLQKSWMPELGALFYSGYNFRAKCIAGLVPYEDETLGGFVTFETVMEQLQKPLPEPEIDATVQLVPEPGTIISFNVPERPPPAHPGTITANISVTGLTPWEIYDRFDDGLKAALASKDLTDVNDALAKFSVPEAEKIVELLQCSEILRVEDSTHDER